MILATPCVLGRVVTALKLLPGIPLLGVCATVKHTIEMAVLFRMLPPPPRTAAIATEGYGSNLALGTPPTRDMLLSPASLSKIYLPQRHHVVSLNPVVTWIAPPFFLKKKSCSVQLPVLLVLFELHW